MCLITHTSPRGPRNVDLSCPVEPSSATDENHEFSEKTLLFDNLPGGRGGGAFHRSVPGAFSPQLHDDATDYDDGTSMTFSLIF